MIFSTRFLHTFKLQPALTALVTASLLVACGGGNGDSNAESASASSSGETGGTATDTDNSGTESESASESEGVAGTDGESMSGSTFDDPGGSNSDSAGSTTDTPTTTTEDPSTTTTNGQVSTSNTTTTTTEDPTTEDPTTGDEPVVCNEIEDESECDSHDECVFVSQTQFNAPGQSVCYDPEEAVGCLDLELECDENFPAGTIVCELGDNGDPWYEFSGCTPSGYHTDCVDISGTEPVECE